MKVRPHNEQTREWARWRVQPYSRWRAMWLAITSALILSGVGMLGAIGASGRHVAPDFNTAYVLVENLLLFIVLYGYNFMLLRRGLQRSALMAAGLIGSLLAAAAVSAVAWTAELHICGHRFNTLPVALVVNSMSALIAFLLSLLLHNVTQRQQTLLENEHLHSENLRIRHETLVQQMSPHFLFNSLNTLDGLVGVDDERAHRYLRQLAAIYRYVLHGHKEVTLAEELNFTHNYIEMMQTRYGDALHVTERVDPSVAECRVAPISLQLLVENAIKHNVVSARKPLTIDITASGQWLTVSNPMQPKADHDHAVGIGLSNLMQRYRMLLGKDIAIHDDGTTFTVKIPLAAAPIHKDKHTQR